MMEAIVTQISFAKFSGPDADRYARVRRTIVKAIKWWAEHQAWPATDEIRVDRHRSTCG